MPLYLCSLCNFKTFKKYDYKRHLKTRKHFNNEIVEESLGGNILDEKAKNKMTQNDPKMTQNDPKMTHSDA